MKAFYKFLEGLCVLLILSMLVVTVIQIVMRYIFDSPLSWTEEVVRFSLVGTTFVGAALVMLDKEHIFVDAFLDVLPSRVVKNLDKIAKFFSAVFLLIMCVYGFIFALGSWRQLAPVTQIKMGYIYMLIPLSAALMLYFLFWGNTHKENKGE